MRVRKLAAGLTILALVGVGAAGISGASPAPSSAHAATASHHISKARLRRLERLAVKVEAIAKADKLPAAFSCANAARDLTRISTAESWIAAYLPRAEAREAAALKAGRTKRAHVIAHRIAEANKLDAALVVVDSLIVTACPS